MTKGDRNSTIENHKNVNSTIMLLLGLVITFPLKISYKMIKHLVYEGNRYNRILEWELHHVRESEQTLKSWIKLVLKWHNIYGGQYSAPRRKWLLRAFLCLIWPWSFPYATSDEMQEVLYKFIICAYIQISNNVQYTEWLEISGNLPCSQAKIYYNTSS